MRKTGIMVKLLYLFKFAQNNGLNTGGLSATFSTLQDKRILNNFSLSRYRERLFSVLFRFVFITYKSEFVTSSKEAECLEAPIHLHLEDHTQFRSPPVLSEKRSQRLDLKMSAKSRG